MAAYDAESREQVLKRVTAQYEQRLLVLLGQVAGGIDMTRCKILTAVRIPRHNDPGPPTVRTRGIPEHHRAVQCFYNDRSA